MIGTCPERAKRVEGWPANNLAENRGLDSIHPFNKRMLSLSKIVSQFRDYGSNSSCQIVHNKSETCWLSVKQAARSVTLINSSLRKCLTARIDYQQAGNQFVL